MPLSKDSSAPVSEDSASLLADVKKGKPRKFVMICKGTSIISLVVFKKGAFTKFIKEAKQVGTGQVTFGIVTGQGNDVRFQIARTDGFDEGPVKTPALKTFLADEADLKCAPMFEVIETLGVVIDDEDPLAARLIKLQTAAMEACDTHPEKAGEINTLCRQAGSYLDEDQNDKALDRIEALEDLLEKLSNNIPEAPPLASPESQLAEHLKQLKPNVDKILAASVAVSQDLKDCFLALVTIAKQRTFDSAEEKLQQAKELVQKGLQQLQSGELAAQFLERIKKLKPEIDRCKTVVSDEAQKIGLLASEAGMFARKQVYADAIRLLDEIEALLPKVPAPKEDPAIAWNRRFAELEPIYLQVLKGDPAEATKIRAIMGYASEQAADGQFEKALQALDRLEPLLGVTPSGNKPTSQPKPSPEVSSSDPSSVPKPEPKKISPQVAFQQSRLDWDSTRKQIQSELQGLEQKILALCKDEPDFKEIAEGTKNLYVILEYLDERLIDKLDKALQATDDDVRRKLHSEAQEIVEEYIDYVEDDDLLQDIDENGFTNTKILSTLTTKLDNMAKQLKLAKQK